ncbi:MAG: B12-binding domain-containing radical SAM protein [Desulfomonile tiedjei]|nr:B12-binding domain-containing radical SAM protein [Desulfomonile tiedjei]
MNRVLFIQLPPPRFAFHEPPTNIPLAAGFLAAAMDSAGCQGMMTEILEPERADVLGDRAVLRSIVARRPAVLAMSLYVWNVERSLFLASNVKRALPQTLVVVGGPEVTPDNRWVLRHPAVDSGVFGEGESRIVPLLETLLSRRNPDRIPGTFFKDRKELVLNTESPAAWDLSRAVYPYLTGKISPSGDGTLFLETVRGCPFRCRYCYYHKAFTKTRSYLSATVERVLDFAYSEESPVREIYLMDPTFNTREGFQDLLRSLVRRRESKEVDLHTELRADLLTRDDVLLLHEAGLVSAEIGLQSVNPDALRAAGRGGDPEKVARGAALLKDAGIDVTTGIILGLPEDTPRGFSKTLAWLKRTEAYSVVHPFVLSILPGTDFRASAASLGITYDPRPPYYVRSTRTFPEVAFRPALLECESLFDMELDYIAPPTLVDSGPGVSTDVRAAEYFSKWIVNVDDAAWPSVLQDACARAADPFTLWFRGHSQDSGMIEIIAAFAEANPHALLHVVLELSELPRPDFLQQALEAGATPAHFMNRSYRPLYGEGEVVTLNFWVIRPDPGSRQLRRDLSQEFASLAGIIWEPQEIDDSNLAQSETPLLISQPAMSLADDPRRLLERLRVIHGDRWEEVLFRDPDLQTHWWLLNRGQRGDFRIVESILLA